jgi:hypothetical protein
MPKHHDAQTTETPIDQQANERPPRACNCRSTSMIHGCLIDIGNLITNVDGTCRDGRMCFCHNFPPTTPPPPPQPPPPLPPPPTPPPPPPPYVPVGNIEIRGNRLGGNVQQCCDSSAASACSSAEIAIGDANRATPGNPENCPLPFSRAREECELAGGYLFTPTTAEEFVALSVALQLTIEQHAFGDIAWIGLNDDDSGANKWGTNRCLEPPHFCTNLDASAPRPRPAQISHAHQHSTRRRFCLREKSGSTTHHAPRTARTAPSREPLPPMQI